MSRNKVRIKSGREAPIMRKILKKTVSSQVNKVENVQELRTMTPPSSSNEEESDSEMSLFSNFSFSKPLSSTGILVKNWPSECVILTILGVKKSFFGLFESCFGDVQKLFGHYFRS